MTEKRINKNDTISEGSVENNAIDLDVSSGSSLTQGSAVSIGEGVMLTAAHNFINHISGKQASSIEATLREGHSTEGGTDNIKRAGMHNIGDYGPSSAIANKSDFAILTTDIENAPNASMIVFENSNDAAGTIRSAGYPGAPINGERLYSTEGNLSKGSIKESHGMKHLRTDKDSSSTAGDGMGAIGGQSGSGVQLDYELGTNDTRLSPLQLDGKLAGTITYGSASSTQNPSLDATQKGAGFTPITEKLYGRIGPIAEQAARSNSDTERYEARKQEVKGAGERWNREAKDAAREDIANNPLDDRDIADRFAENVMVSNQQGADGSTSTFNGSIFNEVNYANQNVNMTIDMKGGYDTADYFVVGAGKGLAVEIGTDTITVQKSYTTEEQIQKDVVTDGVTTQQTVTEIKSHSATDSWKNTEAVNGTGSDDSFLINDLSGVEKLDGRDLPAKADGTAYAENDSLSLDKDIGPVTWEFDKNADGSADRENGWVSDGTHRVRFENMETVNTRNGDTVDGAIQGATPAAIQTGEVSVEDAIIMLTEDQKTLDTAYTGGERSQAYEAISHPDAAAMFSNLYQHGVETLRADITPDMTLEDRVSELLTAGHDATLQAGIDMPEQQRMAEAVQQQQAAQSYEDDYSYGAA